MIELTFIIMWFLTRLYKEKTIRLEFMNMKPEELHNYKSLMLNWKYLGQLGMLHKYLPHSNNFQT